MLYVNGTTYEGYWKRGLFHGNGIFCSVDGFFERYEGTFEIGQFHGKGFLKYSSGATYEGQFKEDIVIFLFFLILFNFYLIFSYTEMVFILKLLFMMENGMKEKEKEMQKFR